MVDLAPILGIVLGSMLAFTTAIMRYQHVDSTKTRDLVYELIETSSRENRELIEKVHLELSSGLGEVRGGLGEVRERLARIEGYLERWPKPPPHDGAAEAA